MSLMRWKGMAAGLLCVAAYAHAGDIYQWKDAQGKVHMGDIVPHKYVDQAKKIQVRVDAAPAAAVDSAVSVPVVQNGQQTAASAPASAPSPEAGTDNQDTTSPKHRADQPGRQIEWDDPVKEEPSLHGKQPLDGAQPLGGAQPADGAWPMNKQRPFQPQPPH